MTRRLILWWLCAGLGILPANAEELIYFGMRADRPGQGIVAAHFDE